MNSHETPILPDFSLADWQGADPRALLQEENERPIARLILVLAVIFNDFKGIEYCVQQIVEVRPKLPEGLSPVRAQLSGMDGQAIRWTVGLLHELMKQLRHHQSDVQSSEFRTLLKDMPNSAQKAWENIERLAFSSEETRQDKTSMPWILQRLRNQLAFHYPAKFFVKGYRRHFFETELSDVNHRAVFSKGQNMLETRFYFADAAAQAAIVSAVELSQEDVAKKLNPLRWDVNMALAHIVGAYLRRVDPSIGPFQPRAETSIEQKKTQRRARHRTQHERNRSRRRWK